MAGGITQAKRGVRAQTPTMCFLLRDIEYEKKLLVQHYSFWGLSVTLSLSSAGCRIVRFEIGNEWLYA